MSPFRSIGELNFEHVWRACPFRSVFASVNSPAPMPPVGAAIFVYDDPAYISHDDARAWASIVEEEAKRGCSFVILARVAAARDRAKALITEELSRRHAERLARCGTTDAPWLRCKQ